MPKIPFQCPNCRNTVYLDRWKTKKRIWCSPKCAWLRKHTPVSSSDELNIVMQNRETYINTKDIPQPQKGKSYYEIYGDRAEEVLEKHRVGCAIAGNRDRELHKNLAIEQWKRQKQDPVFMKNFISKVGVVNWYSRATPEEKEKRLRKVFSGKKHTSIEIKLEELLNDAFPDQWNYVGDGKLWIGQPPANPDFVHRHMNTVIEMNGTYWHRNDNPQDRIDHFAKFGFECIVFTDKDLIDPDKIIKELNDRCNTEEVIV
jgi:hypothetical protein